SAHARRTVDHQTCLRQATGSDDHAPRQRSAAAGWGCRIRYADRRRRQHHGSPAGASASRYAVHFRDRLHRAADDATPRARASGGGAGPVAPACRPRDRRDVGRRRERDGSVAMSVSATVQDRDLSAPSSQELMRLERSIAEEFMGGLPWGSIAWAFTNLAVWLSLWPLTLSGVVPLWAAAPIATLNVILSYLPSHEAQHRIIAREGERLFWLNELVGHLSPVPLGLSYEAARLTHYEHHKHANDSELDPDINTRS